MILLLSFLDDTSVRLVANRLDARGVDYLWFDPARLPVDGLLTLEVDERGRMRRRLHLDGAVHDLDNVTAAWTHRPGGATPAPEIENRLDREYVRTETNDFTLGLLETLDCLWFPATRNVVWRAQLKPRQLQIAGELGFILPPTLMTNDPDALLDFYREHAGRRQRGPLVSKAIHNGRVPPSRWTDHTAFIFTEVVSGRDIGYADSLRYCPTTFQTYIPKASEVRVTVVGEKVFAAEILSQETNRTKYDWRHYDLYHTGHRAHALSVEMEARCITLTRRLGLTYGAIDLIVTPEGEYVFLEINPSGMWEWIEHETGMPVSEAIADLLIAGRDGLVTPPAAG